MSITIEPKLRDLLLSINPSKIVIINVMNHDTRYKTRTLLVIGFDNKQEIFEFRDIVKQYNIVDFSYSANIRSHYMYAWDDYDSPFNVLITLNCYGEYKASKDSNFLFELLLCRYYENEFFELSYNECKIMRKDFKSRAFDRNWKQKERLVNNFHRIYLEKRYTFPIIKREINNVLNNIIYKDMINIIFNYFDDLIIYK